MHGALRASLTSGRGDSAFYPIQDSNLNNGNDVTVNAAPRFLSSYRFLKSVLTDRFTLLKF